MYRRIAEKLYENFVVNKNVAAIQQKESKYFTVKSPITVPLIEEMLRGIHVWIFLDQVISKDLAFAIVVKLREPFYKKIISDERFGLDCFPKTGSGKINNKYGLQVKLPLSRHQMGAYSYFINKEEEQFNTVEYLDEQFLYNQLMFLDKIEKNSVENIICNMNITHKIPAEKIIKFHKKIIIGNKELALADVERVFALDEALNNIWVHITDGRLSSLERVILLGLFGHMENGEKLLYEIMKKQQNFNISITCRMIAKYKKYYFPITFHYLYSLYNNRNCPPQRKDIFIDQFIFQQLGIPYHMMDVNNSSGNVTFAENIVNKEINYFMYNDEVYHLQTLYKMKSFSYYDYCKIGEIIKNIETGQYCVPDHIEFYQYIRKEENKQRRLISLGAQERVITTALANKMMMYLQHDYFSYSYHLNLGMEGDVFYPWISSWIRFKNDVSQYFSYPIFENFYCIKIDIKGFYDNIYLQSMFNNILKRKDIKQREKFRNIYKYLNAINEKIMLRTAGDLRGVPQGPAYARVLAEMVLDEMLSLFLDKYALYQEVKLYRYVDDMFLFFSNRIDGERLLLDLSNHLKERVSQYCVLILFL